MSAFNKFNSFVADVANKVHNLGTDTIKVMLTDTAPVATNTIYTNITQIANGNGYLTAGSTIAITSSAQTSGVYKLLPTAAVVFTAAGGSIAQFRYAVIYNSSAASGQLIGWFDYGSEVNVTVGNTFTVGLDTTNGILQLT